MFLYIESLMSCSLDPIDFHYMDKNSWLIIQNILSVFHE